MCNDGALHEPPPRAGAARLIVRDADRCGTTSSSQTARTSGLWTTNRKPSGKRSKISKNEYVLTAPEEDLLSRVVSTDLSAMGSLQYLQEPFIAADREINVRSVVTQITVARVPTSRWPPKSKFTFPFRLGFERSICSRLKVKDPSRSALISFRPFRDHFGGANLSPEAIRREIASKLRH